MAKILIILLAVIVIATVIFNYALGAARRFFGIAPRAGGFSTRSGNNNSPKGAADRILYKNDDVVVLSGESTKAQSQDRRKVRDADFSDSAS